MSGFPRNPLDPLAPSPAQPPAQPPTSPLMSQMKEAPLALHITTAVGAVVAVIALFVAAWNGIATVGLHSSASSLREQAEKIDTDTQSALDTVQSIRSEVTETKGRIKQHKDETKQAALDADARTWCDKVSRDAHAQAGALMVDAKGWDDDHVAAARRVCPDKLDTIVAIAAFRDANEHSALITKITCERSGRDILAKGTLVYAVPPEHPASIDWSKADFWITAVSKKNGEEIGSAHVELTDVEAGKETSFEARIEGVGNNADHCAARVSSVWPHGR